MVEIQLENNYDTKDIEDAKTIDRDTIIVYLNDGTVVTSEGKRPAFMFKNNKFCDIYQGSIAIFIVSCIA